MTAEHTKLALSTKCSAGTKKSVTTKDWAEELKVKSSLQFKSGRSPVEEDWWFLHDLHRIKRVTVTHSVVYLQLSQPQHLTELKLIWFFQSWNILEMCLNKHRLYCISVVCRLLGTVGYYISLHFDTEDCSTETLLTHFVRQTTQIASHPSQPRDKNK